MSKKTGLPAAVRTASPATAGSDKPAATPNDGGGKRGRSPKTPLLRIGFLLGETETERVRVVGRAFAVSEKKVLEALEAEYLANAFEPHLARVVGYYEAEEDRKREERKAAIFGTQPAVPFEPLIRDSDAITIGTEPDREVEP